MKKAPEISRYGTRLLSSRRKTRQWEFVIQTKDEVWRDLLLTLHRRLTAGERVERRVILHLEEQRNASKDPERRALIDAVCFAVGDDQDIPLAPSKYRVWAEAHAPVLADLQSQVEALLFRAASEILTQPRGGAK